MEMWRIGGAVAYGVVRAVLATVVYELLGPVIFPTAGTGRPLARKPAALALAHLGVAALPAAGAAWGARSLTVRRGPARSVIGPPSR